MALVWDALYLGVLEDGFGNPLYLDYGEGNTTSENASDIVGNTYGGASDPLSDHVVEVTPEDTNGDGVLTTDYNAVVEYINYDLGNGPERVIFDTIVVYNVTLTFNDGTTGEITGVLIQDWEGNAFLAPEFEDNPDHQLMSSKSIQSITIGSVVTAQNANLSADRLDDTFLCFCTGTMVDTKTGPRAIETLRAGDLVQTVDHGFQPVRWIGVSRVPLGASNPKAQPVRIAPGALGENRPAKAVTLSPQHRVLIRSRIAERMTGAGEILIPAKDLTEMNGIDRLARDEVRYVHLLFDRHEIIETHGMESESFYPGPQALKMVGAEHRHTLRKLLGPCYNSSDIYKSPLLPARPFLKGRRARSLVARHLRNGKPIQPAADQNARALRAS